MPPPKHSAAYNTGYKLGTADGRVGGAGLPDGSGACNSAAGINSTAATNPCLAGYFTAWNKYCPTSRYGSNSYYNTINVNCFDSVYYCVIEEKCPASTEYKVDQKLQKTQILDILYDFKIEFVELFGDKK